MEERSGRPDPERILDIDGQRWRVRALPIAASREEADPWHWARIRFEPVSAPEAAPRETWLRIEEDVPARTVLDQYEDEALVESFLVSEEVAPE